MTLPDAQTRDTLREIQRLAKSLEGSGNAIVRDFAGGLAAETRATMIHVLGSDPASASDAGEERGAAGDGGFPVDVYDTHVPLSFTDAFAVLYWGAPVGWAQTGYENLMRTVGHPIEEMLPLDWDIPVVRTVFDYYLPLRLGDAVRVETRVTEVGNRSINMESIVSKDGRPAVRIFRVHVATRRGGGPAALPDWLRALGPARSKRDPAQ